MYLHSQMVIHRDLKLGNLFLDRNMNIKVGDLGLATKLESLDEKRKTICGTPNYIAPEVIQGDRASRGHSFEVDIWSLGVIIYTCLVGKPPYEAKDVKATYQRILANEYSFPKDNTVSENAKDLIRSMLQSRPEDRPSLKKISSHPFFTDRSIPSSLPSNATHVAPIWEENNFGEVVAVSNQKDDDVSKKIGLPRSNSARRPFATRDVNVERAPERGSKMSKPTQGAIDVPGAVKNVLAAVMNVATRSPPTSNNPGFQVYDENQFGDLGKITSDRKPQQNRNADEELVSRTAAISMRPQTITLAPSASHLPPISDPAPRPLSFVESAVTSHQETDAAVLHNMIDRINTVLEITDGRVYTAQQAGSLSTTPLSRGGPTKWVSRYVDYTSKYGLGYLLNDGR
jgi:Protein kinase domain